MVENGQKQAWLTKIFKSGQYIINAVSLNGNQISPLAGFQRGLPWVFERCMLKQMLNLCFQVTTRVNLEKFDHDQLA